MFEGEQKLLEQVHELKNEQKVKGWFEREFPKVTQPSLLQKDLGDDDVSHLFECQKVFHQRDK